MQPSTLRDVALRYLQQMGAHGLVNYGLACQCALQRLMHCQAPAPTCEVAVLCRGPRYCPHCHSELVSADDTEPDDGESLQVRTAMLLLSVRDTSLDCSECDANVQFTPRVPSRLRVRPGGNRASVRKSEHKERKGDE